MNESVIPIIQLWASLGSEMHRKIKILKNELKYKGIHFYPSLPYRYLT